MTPSRVATLVLLGVLVLLAGVAAWVLLGLEPGVGPAGPSASPQGGGAPDAGMAAVELPTEDFANALHGCTLAVRTGGGPEGFAPCLEEEIDATPFPAAPGGEQPVHLVFTRREWTWDAPGRITRAAFLEALQAFLSRTREIEDFRIKVKESHVEADGEMEAHLKLWVIGRDDAGRRAWVRGEADARVRRSGTTWRLAKFHLTQLHSLHAGRDLFTEVSTAAGFVGDDPPVLEHPTLGLAAYGAAAGDLNLDGNLDVFVTGTSGNALYLNRGDGTFINEAANAAIETIPTPGTAPLLFDMENDGDLDVFISTNGNQFLFENRIVPSGRLIFDDISLASGVSVPGIAFSVAAGDINGDALIDLYVSCYGDYGRVLPDRWDRATNGMPNLLFVNQGKGRFREEAQRWGVEDRRWSYAAAFADVDGDRDLDLYVANDFGGGNALFLNEGARFREAAAERGVRDDGYGMGVSFGDYDNDGDLDLHVTKMSSTAGRRILSRFAGGALPGKEALESLAAGNGLYENTGDGRFRDVSRQAGPFSGGWAWGGGFIDVDNDGWLDLHTPNGFLSGPSLKDT